MIQFSGTIYGLMLVGRPLVFCNILVKAKYKLANAYALFEDKMSDEM